MGVHGLWKLLESTGKPINPETLEGKILAVDISIWLNQAVKGVRDREGNNVQNAHLLTLFHRLCKLLFFRIKPVFVYDGDAPLLKKQTLAIRRQRKEEIARESKQTNEKLLRTFLKRQAIKAALGDRSQETIPSLSSVRRDEKDDLYVLPALPPVEEKERSSSSDEEVPEGGEEAYFRFQEETYDDPNSVDINSEEFSLLSPEIKHEILKDMKEFSKRRRTLYHKPPERSGDFSQYQLAGLLQRNKLNQRLEGVEKEMGQRSCGDVEQQCGPGEGHIVENRRLVSEDSSHYILIKGSQKSEKAPQSQSAPIPWSSGPWSRRGRPKGRPEPLWHPVSDDILEKDEPPSSSLSTTPKSTLYTEEQPSDGAPPSPRTLQAIHAAMMDTSSDDDELVPKKTVQNVSRISSSQDDEALSPRTLQAIQSAMMDNNPLPEDPHKDDQVRQRKYVIISSSDEDDADREECAVIERRGLVEAREEGGGGVSPRTLLAIQRALGETDPPLATKLVEQTDLLSSSEGEEMEEVVGTRSKAFRSAASSEGGDRGGEERRSGLGREPAALFPSLDIESDGGRKSVCELGTSHAHCRALLHDQKGLHELGGVPENVSLQQGSLEDANGQNSPDINISEQKEKPNGQLVIKSEDEDSSSEEGFVEVSEGEEESEQCRSATSAEDPSQPPQLDAQKKDEDLVDEAGSQEEDSSEPTPRPSEDPRTAERQDPASPRGTVSAAAPGEWDGIDPEELMQMEKDLQVEQSSLQEQQQQQQRTAATVTGQMCHESQELLRLFGVPFLVAPMEAEAQCAALDRSDQTHGTITDDSDVWLFGGRHVYKNFFSHSKYVEHYQCVDIQNQLGLDRTKLINLAYLLGSDYTEGVPGVGYVTGMEILNEFTGSGLEPLTQFREWWSEAQQNKKVVADPKHTKVKKKLKDLKLHPGFPNPAVAQAYLQPSVDQSEGSFSWGRPQLDLIKEFCFSRFGWNRRKTEETLQPVLKQLNIHQTQLRIDSFFRLEQQDRQAIRSQRLRRAITCLKRKEREGEDGVETGSEDEEESPVKKGKTGADRGVPPAGLFGGGFIGSSTYDNGPEEGAMEAGCSRELGGAVEEKWPVASKNKLSKAGPSLSSSSSSEEDECQQGRGAAMVTARSVFEGKSRGRGRRGARGGRAKTKKNL
ncbi:DNA excision repair protein ERCC-5 [Brachyhypopomus gauderio]|uniref:DNA excision repair protein ERCC-5 n=1 Tax=Brachyhypopomus gauderio TaxID=698409 RepID=UPI0040429AE9